MTALANWETFDLDEHAVGLGFMLVRWHNFLKVAGPGYEADDAAVERLRASAVRANEFGLKKSCASFVRGMLETMVKAERRYAKAEAADFLITHRNALDPADQALLEGLIA